MRCKFVYIHNAILIIFVIFFPQVKLIITPKRTTGLILGYLTYLITTTLTFSLLNWWQRNFRTMPSNYDLIFYDDWNVTVYSMRPGVYKAFLIIESIDYYGRLAMVRLFNPILYGIIVIATILLIIAFKRSIRVRKSLTDKTKAGNSVKENRLVQSVIAVCVIFIVTSSPRNIIKILDRFHTRLPYPYSTFTTELSALLEAINHAIYIFVYVSFNSKFRARFKGLFGLTSVRGVSTKNETKRI